MSKPQQLSEKYTKEIFQEIKSGIYSRADRLPSEPDIAKHFGISPDHGEGLPFYTGTGGIHQP